MWEQIKKNEGLDMKVWEVGKIIGQKWRELSDDDKQVIDMSSIQTVHVQLSYIKLQNLMEVGGSL